MVNPEQSYFGCSNMYVSDMDYRCNNSHGSTYATYIEFDLFVPSLSTALNP